MSMKQSVYKPKRARKAKPEHKCWPGIYNWVDKKDYARNEVILCDCGQLWIAKYSWGLSLSWQMRRLQKWRLTYWKIDRSEA